MIDESFHTFRSGADHQRSISKFICSSVDSLIGGAAISAAVAVAVAVAVAAATAAGELID
jgi:hypothetical protein